MSKIGPIEKNIPIPTVERDGAPNRKYHFHKMEVGDSFVVYDVRNISAAAYAYARKNAGKKFISEKQDDGGIRVWRVK